MYLLIYWVDGEKREVTCDNRNEIEWTLRFIEVGTHYEVWKRGTDGFDFQYSSSVIGKEDGNA